MQLVQELNVGTVLLSCGLRTIVWVKYVPMGRLASVMRCVPLLPAASVKGARSADRLATDLRVNPIVGVLSDCKLAFVLRGCVASRGERAGPNWAGLGALGVAWSMGALIHPDTLIRARPRTDQTILDSGGNDRLDYWPDDHKTITRHPYASLSNQSRLSKVYYVHFHHCIRQTLALCSLVNTLGSWITLHAVELWKLALNSDRLDYRTDDQYTIPFR